MQQAKKSEAKPVTLRTDAPAAAPVVTPSKPATKTPHAPANKPLGGADGVPKGAAPPVKSTPTGTALPTDRPVSTFGFGGNKRSLEKGKRAGVFGEEDTKRVKLERLPSPLPGETADQAPEDDGQDVDMQDGTEEEQAAAAKAAAAQRAERAAQPDATTEDGKNGTDVMEVDNESEVDPLDAFMASVGNEVAKSAPKNEIRGEAILDNADDVDVVAAKEEDADDILAMASKLKKKKELPTVQHSKIDYEPFRRSFYVEPSELAEMTEEEVDDLRLELDGIKIRGQDCPKPVVKWSQCGLPVQNMEVINKLGYEKPTSIQAQAIPAIMSGRNVIGVAKTGSGKTIAFLLPMFRHIKDQRPLEPNEGPIALVMTPTRELAVQIHKECKPFLKANGLRVRTIPAQHLVHVLTFSGCVCIRRLTY